MFSLTIPCEPCSASGLAASPGSPLPVTCPGCGGTGHFDVTILDES